jgi:hypothetical protein
VKKSCAVNVPVAASTARKVMVYLSGVVPVAASLLVVGALPLLAVPPHATIPPRAKAHRRIESIVSARRRPRIPKQRRHASIAPPRTTDQISFREASAAVDPTAVVVTVSVDWTDCAFAIVTVAGLKLHLGILTSLLFVPVTEQVRFTAPVNPPCPPTEIGVVDVVPAARPAAAGVLAPNDNSSVWPVPFPQPAVQATTTGEETAEAAKFASPLYVATILLLPSNNWKTGTSIIPVLK